MHGLNIVKLANKIKEIYKHCMDIHFYLQNLCLQREASTLFLQFPIACGAQLAYQVAPTIVG
jgi:hypothetical protein